LCNHVINDSNILWKSDKTNKSWQASWQKLIIVNTLVLVIIAYHCN
jgi:hypothetical protein